MEVSSKQTLKWKLALTTVSAVEMSINDRSLCGSNVLFTGLGRLSTQHNPNKSMLLVYGIFGMHYSTCIPYSRTIIMN